MVAIVRAPVYALRPGYDQPWQRTEVRNFQLYRPSTDKPAVPVFWRFDVAPDNIWNARPTQDLILFIPAPPTLPFRNIRRFDYIEPPFWQRTVVRNLGIALVPPPSNPFHRTIPWFDPGPDLIWNARPQGYLPPAFLASYRLLADHYLATGYAKAGTIVTEGREIPLGWIPTFAVDPISPAAITAFWNHGPYAMNDAEQARDLYPLFWNRGVGGAGVAPPSIYWTDVGERVYQLTGAGAALGPKRQ